MFKISNFTENLDIRKIVFVLFLVETCSCFSYNHKGPENWHLHIPQCAGERQSPIDIKKDNLVYDSSLKPIVFIDYHVESSFNISYIGHTIQFTALNDSIKMNGSNFTDTFSLNQLHFHWSENDDEGSEHMIDSLRYPLELHLVHKNSHGDIAVLGFLFELSEFDNVLLEPMLDLIHFANSETYVTTNFTLVSILPSRTILSYYRYLGSLTTPPCTEGVIWTIFDERILISKKQLKVFRKNKIVKNFRHPQKLNSRSVFTNKKTIEQQTDSRQYDL